MKLALYLIIGVLIILFLLIIRSPSKSIQFIGSLFVKFVIGGFMIFAINIIGMQFNFHLPLNVYTAFISGILGIPGIVALSVIQVLFIN